MHKKLKEHSVWTDMNIFGELLGNVIQDIYGKETLTLIEEIRVFAKNNLEETALDKLFYQLESLPEERVQIILRAFGLFLGILTIIQRAYKVKDYEEYQGLTLDFDFIGDQDVLPSIHLVFCSHVAETLSAETVASFQHLFDIIYHYRKLTHEPFDEQTIKMMTFVIRELLTKPLHSDDHSLEDDMLRLMAYFKTSLYPSVGILFAKARTEHIPMLGSILKYSTWIGADHEVLTMKTELTTQAVDLYRETLKSCYLDSLDFIESLIAVDPHLLTPSLTAEFHELKQLVTDLPLSSFLLEEMKVRTDKLLDAFQCSKPDALVTQRCFQFRCQIEVFGQYGLVLEQKFDAQRLVLLMESLYQKLFQRRLLRLFEDSPLDLLDLDSKITSADLKNILLLLPVNQQAQWHALSQPHAQTDLSIERIIVTNVSSLYQLMAIRVLLGLIKNTKSFITPVFETIDSIDHSTNIIVTYLEYCKT
jgi:phosphoenolpyruvate carboxylase